MDLNINSPSYYKDIYGIDDDVYRMCRNIMNFMKDKKYSDIIDVIAITPVIAPEDLDVDSKWRNSINYKIKYRLIDIRKSIDFEEYVNSDIDNKCRLIVNNILASVKAISRKGKLDYDKFQKDLLEFLEIEM
ncbi:Imm44 family immunity protein [uncultured Clostridium sp.]|uniref:Imm44 family immunity protein n=1 Tax=uncultured Clostridium sp. TaxID=59620 RepID=UPI0025857207|nr:Imm44 family immunity protein [uncultured Clostridium sp.]MDU1351059.1 Imm44 family immunity protein [Clostridium argentinense]